MQHREGLIAKLAQRGLIWNLGRLAVGEELRALREARGQLDTRRLAPAGARIGRGNGEKKGDGSSGNGQCCEGGAQCVRPRRNPTHGKQAKPWIASQRAGVLV